MDALTSLTVRPLISHEWLPTRSQRVREPAFRESRVDMVYNLAVDTQTYTSGQVMIKAMKQMSWVKNREY